MAVQLRHPAPIQKALAKAGAFAMLTGHTSEVVDDVATRHFLLAKTIYHEVKGRRQLERFYSR